MTIKDEQAEAYIEEANLSIESGQAALEKGRAEGKELWNSVVKSSYDAIEQAISALLAKEGFDIPKSHPGKVEKFVNEFGESEITQKAYKWLSKRSKSQYVDVERGEVVVPHENFNEMDAVDSLEDARFVVERVEKKLSHLD
ncbi:MAG: HEPN domain-containing protein [Candidatus Aenigmatarchaeota archaeon]